MEAGTWLGALLVAAAIAWYLASAWPIAVVASLAALDGLRQIRTLGQASHLVLQTASPVVRMVYEFNLQLTDQFWHNLGLTAEERAIVDAYAVRPVGFVLEQWSGSFSRWRIMNWDSGRTTERTVDVHPTSRAYIGRIDFWEIQLGEGYESGKISFDWNRRTEEVRFYAFEGRFGAKILPDGELSPASESIFFKVPVPFASKGEQKLRETADISRSRTPDPPLDSEREPLGREFFMCKNEDRGFAWYLTRSDLRPKLVAGVLKVHKALWTRDVRGFTLRLQDTGLKIWVTPAAVEPDGAGRQTLHRGEYVNLVLDKQFEVDRIWPLDRFYVPVKCPECKRQVGSFSGRNADGVCYDCRPPKECARCYKRFDQRLLHEEHGELVCSSVRCRNWPICPVCQEGVPPTGRGFEVIVEGEEHPFETLINGVWVPVHGDCKQRVERTKAQ